jgi:hypothetical protein
MIGNCRLCELEKELQKSHIIPDFFWRHIKNHHGQFVFVTIALEPIAKLDQETYNKEPLLCWDCEQKIKAYEDYAKALLFEPKKLNVTITDTPTKRYITGIDYDKFRLFQLSILWRARISSQAFFSNVQLDSFRNRALRRMIDEEQPCKADVYGCRMTLFYDDVDENFNKNLDRILTNPAAYGMQSSPIMGQSWQVYRFLFGGYVWDLYVGGKKLSINVRKYFLKDEGTLCILIKSIWDNPLLKECLIKAAIAEPQGKLKQK